MNTTRDNERLKLCIRSESITEAMYKVAETAPVFEFDQWTAMTKDEFTYLQQIGVLDPKTESMIPLWSPFPCFRIKSTDGWVQCWHSKERGQWHMLRWLDWQKIIEAYGLQEEAKLRHLNGVCYMVLQCFPDYGWNRASHVYSTGGLKRMVSEQSADAMSGLGVDTWKTLCAFVCNCALPSTSIVQIKPKGGEHKAVKWHHSRTHYVLLTHMQAQRMQKTGRSITDHDIKRAAHARRAHFRRLGSPRFTYRRGFVVPVKQAWVGPKQWEGSDKKVYKIWNVEKPTGQT